MRVWSLIPVFFLTSIAWLLFGAIMENRTATQQQGLMGEVHDLWGAEHTQQAPAFERSWTTSETVTEVQTQPNGSRLYDSQGLPVTRLVKKTTVHRVFDPPNSTDVTVDIRLDMRRKGLLWFPLYDNDFSGTWTYQHDENDDDIVIVWPFPEEHAVYDNFRFAVDGVDLSNQVKTSDGEVRYRMPMTQGQVVELFIGYSSRGMSSWKYQPTEEVTRIPNFKLAMTTDFDAIDFPTYTLSPSLKERTPTGWLLHWDFTQVVTAHGMGMIMPERIQPGPLVAKLSFSAPISLGLFMVWLTVIGIVKGTKIHWVNHLFIAASFFSFHLLFGYSADHIPVEWAFALSAAVSMALVASYLRLVVGPRFALLEAGVAQFVYLVVFAMAHFLDGYTGLSLTVLGIGTLAAVMQLTAKVNWNEGSTQPSATAPSPGGDQAE